MQTWMPAIHAGMTNAAFSSSVDERKLMKHFVVKWSCVLYIEPRVPRVPVGHGLIGIRCVQDGLITEPGADQLHPDWHAFRTHAAGNRATGQTEHAGQAQKIGVIVARMPRIIAVPSKTFR